MLFLNIFTTIVLPLFVLIGAGFIAGKIFRLDIPTLSKINFYVFTPAVIFAMVLDSNLQAGEILGVGVFSVIHAAILYIAAVIVFSIKPLAEKRMILSFGSVFYNAGIYGIPLMLMAFGEDAVSVIAIVLTVQALLFFTVGLLLFEADRAKPREIFSKLLKYPVLYAILLAFVLRALQVELPSLIRVPLDHLVNGFIAIALVTLGAQLSQGKVGGNPVMILAITVMRLLISPLVAVGLIYLFHFEQSINAVLIVGAGLPVAVNTYILAVEVGREADFASRMVFWTTLISAGSIPLLLLLVR